MTSGAVALVTGGASGIGAATAMAFAARGDAVCVADVDPVGADVVRRIRSAGGLAVHVPVDVSSPIDVDRMVDRTVDEWGRLDFAFNAAGVLHDRCATAHLSIESWRRVLTVNLDGVFHCLQAEIPAMIAGGGGVIVNAASVAGVSARSGAGLAAYAASKAAVIQLTKVAARDHAADGIRAVAVAPGAIDTPMVRGSLGGAGADTDALVVEAGMAKPFGRLGRSSEVAATVVWLCSEAASFISGSTIQIDGAEHA